MKRWNEENGVTRINPSLPVRQSDFAISLTEVGSTEGISWERWKEMILNWGTPGTHLPLPSWFAEVCFLAVQSRRT